MKRVYQRRPGECVAACLATIFGENMATMPPVHEFDPTAQALWANERGYAWVEIAMSGNLTELLASIGNNPRLVYVLLGKSETGHHAVVVKGNAVWHDPAVEGFGHTLIEPCDDGHWHLCFLVPYLT